MVPVGSREILNREGESVTRNLRGQLPRQESLKTCGRFGLQGEDSQLACSACPGSF